MKIKQLISYPNPNELGLGNTNETYIRVGNELDVSDIFPPYHEVEVVDCITHKTFQLKAKNDREFRINQLGALYRDFNVCPGDEIKFTQIDNGKKTVFFSVVNYNRIFLNVTSKGAEIVNIERLSRYVSSNREYTLKINEGTLKLTYDKSDRKRTDSPAETDFYKMTVNGVDVEKGYYYITIQDGKNILEEVKKNRVEEYVVDESRENEIKAAFNGSLQQIYYGTPGTGKSYEVKRVTGEIDVAGNEYSLPNVFRTTFHPDTDYAGFVGCYKPIEKESVKYGLNGNATIPFSDDKGNPIKEDYISYAFEPQVFTEAYVYAYNHPDENTYLVIEEINRGNCAQIFGDLFQLLDRKEDGTSEYKIKADSSLAKFLVEAVDEAGNPILENKEGIAERKLCLPANLSILATMNTSDQSLFPMDSAFKRRWDWKYVPIRYDEEKSSEFMIEIGSHRYSWVSFLQAVNPRIQNITSSEDKMMGNFFIKGNVDAAKFNSKVMFYLWNEVLKDEVENNNYFFFGKNGVENEKFMFSDLYGNKMEETLVTFMKTLNVDEEIDKDYGDGGFVLDSTMKTWYKSLWSEVKTALESKGLSNMPDAPQRQHYQIGIGLTGISVIASVPKTQGNCWVGAFIEAKQAKVIYPKVQAKQEHLDSIFKNGLQWIEDRGDHRRISVEMQFDDLNDENNRKALIDWVVDKLYDFYTEFKTIVPDLR